MTARRAFVGGSFRSYAIASLGSFYSLRAALEAHAWRLRESARMELPSHR